MTAPIDYNEIPMQEKFIIMEELWENMSHKAENNGFTPDWHLHVLANREDSIKNSKSNFSDLELAKERLQKLTYLSMLFEFRICRTSPIVSLGEKSWDSNFVV